MLSVLGPAPSKLGVEHWSLQNSFPTRKDVFLVEKGPGRVASTLHVLT